MTESIQFFLHGHAKRPQLVTALESETLQEVLARADGAPRDGELVFVGEAEEALQHPDVAEDTQSPVNPASTLRDLNVRNLKHVHTRTVRRVQVTVNFNGAKKRSFSPTATVETVLRWAKKVFHIDPSAGADLVLELVPSGEQPRPDVHVGDLLQPGQPSLEFNLVREVTPQG